MSRFLGAPAPSFRLASVAGAEMSTQDFLGRWLLLVFHRHLA
ncbi:MAG: hypothetical protein R3B13_36120 [Polyangiaceae bacterium]